MPAAALTPERTSYALASIAHGRDTAAWALVVERHGAMVAAICQRICGPGALADDACQETWLLLPRVAGQFRALDCEVEDEALAAAWIRRIAANVALTLLRRQRRANARDGRAMTHLETQDDHAHDSEALHLALAKLSERARQPLVLMYFGGLDYPRLAASIGCSIPAARVRVHRAIEKLRHYLPSQASPMIGLLAGATALQSPAAVTRDHLVHWLTLGHSTSVKSTLAVSTIMGNSAIMKLAATSLLIFAVACPVTVVTLSQHAHAAEASSASDIVIKNLQTRLDRLEHRQVELERVAEAAQRVIAAAHINTAVFNQAPPGADDNQQAYADATEMLRLQALRDNLQAYEQLLSVRKDNPPAPVANQAELSQNEMAAATALRSGVLPAMVQYQAAEYVDQSGNGIGQYGLFPEMTGKIAYNNVVVQLIAPVFGVTEPVVVGYHFKIYLPAGANSAMTSNADGSRTFLDKVKDAEAIDLQSHYWRCYAWPDSGTGLEFVIDQTSILYARPYSGSAPAWNAINPEGGWKDIRMSKEWLPCRHSNPFVAFPHTQEVPPAPTQSKPPGF
jgi:RNA polymerase sigma factor (sigma-70 family)